MMAAVSPTSMPPMAGTRKALMVGIAAPALKWLPGGTPKRICAAGLPRRQSLPRQPQRKPNSRGDGNNRHLIFAYAYKRSPGGGGAFLLRNMKSR